MKKIYNVLIAINVNNEEEIKKIIKYITLEFSPSRGDKQLLSKEDIFSGILSSYNYNDLQVLVDDNTKLLYDEYCNYLNLNYTIYIIGDIENDSDYDKEINEWIKIKNNMIYIKKIYILKEN